MVRILLRSKMGGRDRIYDDVTPLAAKRTVATWLKTLREGPGRNSALYHFASWIRWRREKALEADPDVLVEECLDGTARVLVRHLQAILEYCNGPRFEGDTHETRKRHYNSLRGFYSANLVCLPRLKLKNGEPPNNGVRQEITATDYLQMFKKALEFADVRDRALMFCALQGGMDDSTLANVFNVTAFPQMAKHFGTNKWREWNTELCPVRIDLVRPKSEYRYYTFEDIDAVEALKIWFDFRGAPRLLEPENPRDMATSEPIFLGHGRPIVPAAVGRAFREVGKRCGVNVGMGPKPEEFKGARLRYVFHSHEVRDTMVTLAKRVDADVIAANFFCGHSIDKMKYDKSPWDFPEHYEAEYLKIARPFLNPISGKILEAKAVITQMFEERLASIERQMAERLSARS